MTPEPFGELNPPYSTILADPPWPFRWVAGAGGRRRRATTLPYTTQPLEWIESLPVADLAAADATLFLWCTREVYREGWGVRVARAWGFEPVAEFIWRKRNFGAGAWPRPGHEPLLVARRGNPPVPKARNLHSVQDWAQVYDTNSGKGHSRKPPGAIDLAMACPGPYLELFARSPALGWDAWGHGFEQAALP